jgi:serine/threonine protein phosphatase PrpC
MELHVHGETETGRVRDHNEDSILKLGGEQSPPGVDALLVVADGMGGHAAGEVASKLTVDRIEDQFTSGAFSSTTADEFEEALRTLLQNVNQAVYSAGQDTDKRGMGTTCTLVVIKDDHLYYAHVGDSRAYLLRGGELDQVTDDHSWVEEMVRAGSLSKEEARTHPNRNVITRAIGLDASVVVDTGVCALKDGDLVMLCSDGLNSMISDEEIHNVLEGSSHKTVCTDLIAAANQSGGHDNTSVVAACVGDQRKSRASNRQTVDIKSKRSFLKRIWKFILRLK